MNGIRVIWTGDIYKRVIRMCDVGMSVIWISTIETNVVEFKLH